MGIRLHKWSRRTIKWIVYLLIICMLSAWVAGEWIIPSYIRKLLQESTVKFWDGSLTIQKVKFSYRGEIELHALNLDDAQGNQWIESPSVKILLGNWPGLNPTLDDIEADELRIRVYQSSPIRRPDEPVGHSLNKSVTLNTIRVHSLHISGGYGKSLVNLNPVHLAINHTGGKYILLANSLPGEERLGLLASLEPQSGQIKIEADIDREITPQTFEFLCQSLGWSLPINNAGGQLSGRFNIRGNLGSISSFKVFGEGDIRNGVITLAEETALEDLTTNWSLDDRQMRFYGGSCRAIGGRLAGEGLLDFRGESVSVRAKITAEKMDLSAITDMAGTSLVRQGTLDGEFAIEPIAGGAIQVLGDGNLRATTNMGVPETIQGPFAFCLQAATAGEQAWNPRGTVTIEGWHVSAPEIEDARFYASLILAGRHIRVENATVQALQGTLNASGWFTLPEHLSDKGIVFAIDLAGEDIRGNKLAEAMGLPVAANELCLGLRAYLTGSTGTISHMRASGSASVMLAGQRQDYFEGVWELGISGMGGHDMQTVGSITNWKWYRDGDELIQLARAKVNIHGEELTIRNSLFITRGGQVEVGGQLHLAEPRKLQHHWQFSCRDFDIIPMLSSGTEHTSATKMNMNGTLTGQGVKSLVIRMSGHAGIHQSDPMLHASADVSIEASMNDLLIPGLVDRFNINAKITDGVAGYGGKNLAEGITGSVKVASGDSPLTRLCGNIAGGRFSTDVVWLRANEQEWTYNGQIDLEDIDIAQLPSELAVPPWVEHTAIDGSLTVNGSGRETIRVCGKGIAEGQLNSPESWSVSGRYDFDSRIMFSATDALQVHGKVNFSECDISNSNSTVAEGFRCSMQAFGRSVDVGGIRGVLMGGKALGMLRLDFEPDHPVLLRGWMAVNDMSLAHMGQTLGKTNGNISGTMNCEYGFSAQQFALQGVRGRGKLQIRNSRMETVPLMESLLVAVRLQPQAASNTDLELLFDNTGEIATILDGRLATSLMAVKPITGGTVNLATRELDIHVVAALLDDIDELVEIPFLELLIPFTHRVSQLHLTGTWESRDTIDIRKEPMRDIGEATLKFFKGVVKTGGDLGTTVTEPMQELMP